MKEYSLRTIVLWAIAVFYVISCSKNSQSNEGVGADSEISRLVGMTHLAADDDLSRVMQVNAWIASSVGTISGAAPGTAEETLQRMQGYCGNRDMIISLVTNELGLNHRRVAFFGIPMQLGHTASEVYVEGDWRFFDSSFGVYFTEKSKTLPIGLEKARALYPEIDVYKVDAPLYTGKWMDIKSLNYKLFTEKVINNPGNGLPMSDFERTYFASEVAGIKEENIYFSNISVSLNEKTSEAIGAVDGSGMDIAKGYSGINKVSQYTPLMERIGRYGNVLAGKRFIFNAIKEKRICFDLAILNYNSKPLADVDHFDGTYGYEDTLITVNDNKSMITYSFYVKPPGTYFRLWNTGDKFTSIDAYSWKEC